MTREVYTKLRLREAPAAASLLMLFALLAIAGTVRADTPAAPTSPTKAQVSLHPKAGSSDVTVSATGFSASVSFLRQLISTSLWNTGSFVIRTTSLSL